MVKFIVSGDKGLNRSFQFLVGMWVALHPAQYSFSFVYKALIRATMGLVWLQNQFS